MKPTADQLKEELHALRREKIELDEKLRQVEKKTATRRQRYINLTCKFKPGTVWRLPEYGDPVYQVTRIRPVMGSDNLDAVVVYAKLVMGGLNDLHTKITGPLALHSRESNMNFYLLERADLLVDKLNRQA